MNDLNWTKDNRNIVLLLIIIVTSFNISSISGNLKNLVSLGPDNSGFLNCSTNFYHLEVAQYQGNNLLKLILKEKFLLKAKVTCYSFSPQMQRATKSYTIFLLSLGAFNLPYGEILCDNGHFRW